MKNSNIRALIRASMIAALYVVLTLLSALAGLSSGAVQIRIAEALCVLPVFSASAIPGVTIGCLLANLLTGGTIWDLTIGVAATFLGAVLARCMRSFPTAYFSSLPTIFANGLLIPFVLILAGFIPADSAAYGMAVVTVSLGEIIACGGIGTLLLWYLAAHPKTRTKLFG